MDISSVNSQVNAKTVKSSPYELAAGAAAKVAGASPSQTRSPGSPNAETNQQKADTGPEQIKKALEDLNNFVKQVNSDVNFSIDDETGMRVIKVIDRQTKDVIRQIPSEEALEMAKAIDKFQGLLIKQTA